MPVARRAIKTPAFSLTPYLESFTPTFGLGTPGFPRMSSNLHLGAPTFPKRCLWDSYFHNPSENPELNKPYCTQKGQNSINPIDLRKAKTPYTLLHSEKPKTLEFWPSECNRVNPLYTGRLFYCYMLDKSFCHFRGVRSVLSLLFYF